MVRLPVSRRLMVSGREARRRTDPRLENHPLTEARRLKALLLEIRHLTDRQGNS